MRWSSDDNMVWQPMYKRQWRCSHKFLRFEIQSTAEIASTTILIVHFTMLPFLGRWFCGFGFLKDYCEISYIVSVVS